MQKEIEETTSIIFKSVKRIAAIVTFFSSSQYANCVMMYKDIENMIQPERITRSIMKRFSEPSCASMHNL